MKKIENHVIFNYDEIIDTFECEVLVEESDDDYQGDTYVFLRNDDMYGILIFGWGSCSGCDALESISCWKTSGCSEKHISETLKSLTEFRDEMYESITWRKLKEMKEYIEVKDFKLEWYGNTKTGRKFVTEVQSYLKEM